jgi:hypothetical protein
MRPGITALAAFLAAGGWLPIAAEAVIAEKPRPVRDLAGS